MSLLFLIILIYFGLPLGYSLSVLPDECIHFELKKCGGSNTIGQQKKNYIKEDH